MHHVLLRRCLDLAERGKGLTSPNPLVGAVIVNEEGEILAEGWHRGFGEEHAEIMAIQRAVQAMQDLERPFETPSPRVTLRRSSKSDVSKCAGWAPQGDTDEELRSLSEATLYVNLEPCGHQGNTPPCTEAILKAGIRRVVFGARDPSHGGAAVLRRAGIEVIGPILEAECRRLNRGFFSIVEQGKPWVTLKKAVTSKGRVANLRGQPRLKITSEEQDRWAHVRLRATHDAILVGSGTIVADNPQLIVQLPPSNRPRPCNVQPRRIVLDPRGKVPPTATVLTDECAERTLMIRRRLPIPELLQLLKEEGIASVLIEGGPRVWRSFEDSGCVDETIILVGQPEAR